MLEGRVSSAVIYDDEDSLLQADSKHNVSEGGCTTGHGEKEDI